MRVLMGGILILLVTVCVVPVTAPTPPILRYSISNVNPFISEVVIIRITLLLTDEFGNTYNTNGMQATCYWSRDQSNYVGEDMTLATSTQYEVSLPRQDGVTNSLYNGGPGRLYWYIVIENSLNEQTRFYTAINPNQEITYRSDEGTTTNISPLPSTSAITVGQASPIDRATTLLQSPMFFLFVIAVMTLFILGRRR